MGFSLARVVYYAEPKFYIHASEDSDMYYTISAGVDNSLACF